MNPIGSRKSGRFFASAAFLPLMLLLLAQTAMAAGTAGISVNLTAVYGITAAVSMLFVVAYCVFIKKKELWLLLLFISVFVVNLGYLALSVSRTLEEALLANRIAYLGSAFLPLCMLMTIIDVCGLKPPKAVTGIFITVSVAAFLLAASPGYLDVYYKEAYLVFVGGTAKLEKVYGPLHCLYLYYLISYFAMMLGTIVFAVLRRHRTVLRHVFLLLTVVFLNLAIWFVEQIIRADFEFLAVSYIVSELLLVLLYGLLQEQTAAPAPVKDALEDIAALEQLTAREKDVLQLLLEDVKRKDIAQRLNVTENTVKKHTSNIFAKLEVASRQELAEKLLGTTE